MANPVDVDNRFRELLEDLESVQSQRVRVELIFDFLALIDGDYSRFGSYLLQLTEQLPRFRHPLQCTGIDPEWLLSFLAKLEKASEELPQLKSNQRFSEVLSSLYGHCAMLYHYMGELERMEECISAKNRWIDNLPGDEPAGGGKSRDLVRAELEHEIKSLQKKGENLLMVPVYEENSRNCPGRLRMLKVRVNSRNPGGEDKLDKMFHSLNSPDEENYHDVLSAFRLVLTEHHPGLKDTGFSFDFMYEIPSAVHDGRSAFLAMAGLMVTSAETFAECRERYLFREGTVVTGDINSRGELLPVDVKGIPAKVQAAFFSWAKRLVVPEEQKELFEKELKKLAGRYRNREIELIGIRTIHELFYDRRIAKKIETAKTVHLLKKIWRRRYSAAGVVTIIFLSAIIVWLLAGPYDRNPVYAEFKGGNMLIKNQYGATIKQFYLTPNITDYINEAAGKPRVQFYDLTGDGKNEVIWAEWDRRFLQQGGMIHAWSMSGDSLIWTQPVHFDLDFPKQQGLEQIVFSVDLFFVTENREGKPVLVAANDPRVNFPGVISLHSAETGELISYYMQTGKFFDTTLADVTGDGTPEVIAVGVNNAYWMASVAVLQLDNLRGHSPTEGDYLPRGMERGEELAYFLIPKTIVGQVFDEVYKYNRAYLVRNREEYNQFEVRVREVPMVEFRDHDYLPYLIYTFDYDFNMVSTVTNDVYDVFIRRMYEEGDLPFIPGFDYWEGFRDSLIVLE